MENSNRYIIAEGPEGLKKVLEDILQESRSNPQSGTEEYYILYQLVKQKSLIIVNTSRIPFSFQHYDSMGRFATGAVKNTIVNFLCEQCDVGSPEAALHYFVDKTGLQTLENNKHFITGECDRVDLTTHIDSFPYLLSLSQTGDQLQSKVSDMGLFGKTIQQSEKTAHVDSSKPLLRK